MTDGSGTWREKTETDALPLAKFRRRTARAKPATGNFRSPTLVFSCRISTPASTPRNVAANCGHGVLELTLPLTETAKPPRIAIGTGSNDTVENAA